MHTSFIFFIIKRRPILRNQTTSKTEKKQSRILMCIWLWVFLKNLQFVALTRISKSLLNNSTPYTLHWTVFEFSPSTLGRSDCTYSPLLANSMDLMAVVLRVPVVTLNEAFSSRSVLVNTRIWQLQRENTHKISLKQEWHMNCKIHVNV